MTESWAFVVDLGCDGTGKRFRRWFYGKTKNEVRGKVERAKLRAGGSLTRVGPMTAGEYIKKWLNAVDASRSPRTALDYRSRLKLYALPTIGKVRLEEIDAHRISAPYAQLTARGVSADNVQKVHRALRLALNVAIGKGLIGRNPCAFVERPTHRKKRRKAFSAEEVARIFKAAADDPLGAFARLGILGLMRPGELYALAWADVDLDGGVVHVRTTLQERQREIVPAKADSARSIPLEPETVDACAGTRPAWACDLLTYCQRPAGSGSRSARPTMHSRPSFDALKSATTHCRRLHALLAGSAPGRREKDRRPRPCAYRRRTTTATGLGPENAPGQEGSASDALSQPGRPIELKARGLTS